MPMAQADGGRRRNLSPATVGSKAPSGIGTDALLDFRMEVSLDGERLSGEEIAKLLASSDGLHFIRGRWVELNREKLTYMIEEFQAAERAAAADGLSFAKAMRMLSAANITGDEAGEATASDWSRISAGP